MKLNKKIFIILFIFIIIINIYYNNNSNKIKMLNISTNNKNIINKNYYEVLDIIDGDTIEIKYNKNIERVRLIGIDTPESKNPDKSKNIIQGKTASEYMKKILNNKLINIEFDIQERDKYGRLLLYIYLNNEMINEKLLKEGYARLATYLPNVKYVDKFINAQKYARENNIGFWEDNIF